jgi:hypothetical protein
MPQQAQLVSSYTPPYVPGAAQEQLQYTPSVPSHGAHMGPPLPDQTMLLDARMAYNSYTAVEQHSSHPYATLEPGLTAGLPVRQGGPLGYPKGHVRPPLPSEGGELLHGQVGDGHGLFLGVERGYADAESHGSLMSAPQGADSAGLPTLATQEGGPGAVHEIVNPEHGTVFPNQNSGTGFMRAQPGVGEPLPHQDRVSAFPDEDVAPAFPNQGMASGLPYRNATPAFSNHEASDGFTNQEVAAGYPNDDVAPDFPGRGEPPVFHDQGVPPAFPDQEAAPSLPNQDTNLAFAEEPVSFTSTAQLPSQETNPVFAHQPIDVTLRTSFPAQEDTASMFVHQQTRDVPDLRGIGAESLEETVPHSVQAVGDVDCLRGIGGKSVEETAPKSMQAVGNVDVDACLSDLGDVSVGVVFTPDPSGTLQSSPADLLSLMESP